MAIVAAVLALVSVSGHVQSKEELLLQQKASDQWSYYQGKAVRRYQSEVARDVLVATGAAEAAKRYERNLERYQKEGEEIQEKAKEYERESESKGRRAFRLEMGEIFLEVAIVLCSLTILTQRPVFWWAGMASSLLGAALSATVFLVH